MYDSNYSRFRQIYLHRSEIIADCECNGCIVDNSITRNPWNDGFDDCKQTNKIKIKRTNEIKLRVFHGMPK